jgi:KamA family protein
LEELTRRAGLSEADRAAVQAVALVLPFRCNTYITEELIDWVAAPNDPIYRLTFPQPDMLPADDLTHLTGLLSDGVSPQRLQSAVEQIRARLNPHPAGQQGLNVPVLHGRPLRGLQHKYRETVLFFPRQGQTCHAYCTYCFRWAQFVGDPALKIASSEVDDLVEYLRVHPEVSDVILTGGDPMTMSSALLRRYMEPLLELDQLDTIRIGTKALAYWPHRFTRSPDAGPTLRLFEQVRAAGKHLAVMAHYTHPRELLTGAAAAAIGRLRDTGVQLRTQAPLIRTINDQPGIWADMWRQQVRHGMVPYYMFVERDTGPHDYFAVPLVRAHDIFTAAYRETSGMARTVRGPSMSTTHGKITIDGTPTLNGTRLIALRYLQARDPAHVNQPFYAHYNPDATWIDDLTPAGGPFPGEPLTTH